MHLCYNIGMNKSILVRLKEWIEKVLPMTLNGLVLFSIVIYLLFVVGRSIWINYESRKDIAIQKIEIKQLERDVENLKFQIAYYQTNSFKEKEARAKLGYKAPGENVISLSVDSKEDRIADKAFAETKLKTSNQILWWRYFFGG